MNHYIAFDSHKRYTVAAVEEIEKKKKQLYRINHERGQIRSFLEQWGSGGAVAVETVGNWYWIVDEIEQAGMEPLLVHAQKSKLMMGMIDKTDKLDAEGLNRLQRAGTLPTVWIPPRELRDKREIYRQRMYLVQERTRCKNRIHAMLAKYGYREAGQSDVFGGKGREELEQMIGELPKHSREMSGLLVRQFDQLEEAIGSCETAMKREFAENEEVKLLMSLPGVGFLLATVITNEVGDIGRFARSGNFASYCGTTPTVYASGGKTRHGRTRKACNRYLKWAYCEAANVICRHQGRWPGRHTVELYKRVMHKKNHGVAIGAVSRHLAEATFHILKRREPYRDPSLAVLSGQG